MEPFDSINFKAKLFPILYPQLAKLNNPYYHTGGPRYAWPMMITAGDISRYGRRILIRNYPVMRMWTREDDQFVEDAIMYTEPCEFKLKDEPLGESLAIRDTDAGFVTTSDGQSHPPLYFYEFN